MKSIQQSYAYLFIMCSALNCYLLYWFLTVRYCKMYIALLCLLYNVQHWYKYSVHCKNYKMKLNNFDEDLKVEKSYDKFMKFTKK